MDTGTYAYMDLLSTSSAGINFGDAGGSQRGVIEYNHSSDYMRFITAGGERMRIFSDGDVSIGMTNNYAKLNVNGDIRAENSNRHST